MATSSFTFDHLTVHMSDLHPDCGMYLLFDATVISTAVEELEIICADARQAFGENLAVFNSVKELSRLVDKLLSHKKIIDMSVADFDLEVHRFLYGRDSFQESCELTFDVGESVLVFNDNFPEEVDYITKSWHGHQHFYFIFEAEPFKQTLSDLFKAIKNLHKKIVARNTCSTLDRLLDHRMQHGGNEALLKLTIGNVDVDINSFDNFVERL